MKTKEEVFRIIWQQKQLADKFIDSLPRSINEAFFANEYTDAYNVISDTLMMEYFGRHWDSVYWFLYEWKQGFMVGIYTADTVINNIDEYIEWMKKHENFQ